jgi:hypothetical protein
VGLGTIFAVPATAAPRFETGGTLIQRDGDWGCRLNVAQGFQDSDFSLAGEWSLDRTITSYAGTARYRFGSDWLGVSPLAGWRGQVGGAGITGPEVGLGLDLAFSPQVPSLQAEASALIGLNGAVTPHLRLMSRYRVLTFLDLQASYRLEQWASWTQVWGVGASFVL